MSEAMDSKLNNSTSRLLYRVLRILIASFALALYSIWSGLALRGASIITASNPDALAHEATLPYMAVLALGSLIIALSRRSGFNTDKQFISLVVAAILVSGGAALCSIDLGESTNTFPMVDSGLALSGLGMAIFMPFFATLLFKAGPKDTTISVLASNLLSSYATSFLWKCGTEVCFFAAVGIPFILAALLVLEKKHATPSEIPLRQANTQDGPLQPLPWSLLVVVVLSGLLGSLVRAAMYYSGESFYASPADSATIFTVVLGSVMLVLLVLGKEYDTYSLFWPWLAILMLAGCIALPFLGTAYPAAIVAFFSVAHVLFNAFNYTVFVDLASRYNRDIIQLFCWGRAADALGCILGLFLGFIVFLVVPASSHRWYTLSIISSTAMVLLMILALRNRHLTDYPRAADDLSGTVEPKDNDDSSGSDDRDNSDDRAGLDGFGLSERELEVARLLGQGRSIPFIAKELVISASTVKTHVENIYRKCGVHSRQQLLDLIHTSRSL